MFLIIKFKTGKAEGKIKGTLFICATPIGNLEDVSFRLIRILTEVDLIAAEDTRTIKKLLQKYDILKKYVVSYHDFSKKGRINYITGKLEAGENIALVSESGTPAIQDPGFELINECIKGNITVTVVPGPNAAISALVLSGLPADNFLFIGFLPKTGAKRKNKLSELATFPYTIIFYESPNRIEALTGELIERFGDRRASLVREITKIYEEVIRGKLSDILTRIKKKKVKGEIVLVIEGYKKELIKSFSEEDMRKELIRLLKQGISKKSAIKITLSRYDIDKQRLYNIATKI
ncbi:MAG: 16S rRNA (cytidine(1402)-2'-O)-methyltransferase [Actinobacteria bacterium]|nr:16S rRNA (cytidine(1402)-2'-O)-methyltransferase [Actinomycetota bacterium]